MGRRCLTFWLSGRSRFASPFDLRVPSMNWQYCTFRLQPATLMSSVGGLNGCALWFVWTTSWKQRGSRSGRDDKGCREVSVRELLQRENASPSGAYSMGRRNHLLWGILQTKLFQRLTCRAINERTWCDSTLLLGWNLQVKYIMMYNQLWMKEEWGRPAVLPNLSAFRLKRWKVIAMHGIDDWEVLKSRPQKMEICWHFESNSENIATCVPEYLLYLRGWSL